MPKPSEIDIGLRAVTPLAGCFGKVEAEITAALYVHACVLHGDAWGPQGPSGIGHALDALGASERPPSWVAFMRWFGYFPNPQHLVVGGWFTRLDDRHRSIEPTPLFFSALEARGLVRRPVEVAGQTEASVPKLGGPGGG